MEQGASASCAVEAVPSPLPRTTAPRQASEAAGPLGVGPAQDRTPSIPRGPGRAGPGRDEAGAAWHSVAQRGRRVQRKYPATPTLRQQHTHARTQTQLMAARLQAPRATPEIVRYPSHHRGRDASWTGPGQSPGSNTLRLPFGLSVKRAPHWPGPTLQGALLP